jgi:PST family polysaccharide transporter
MTIVVTLILAALTPSIGAFYNEPAVTWIMLVSLIGFVFSGLSLQHRALLNRELKFSVIASIDSAAQLLGYGITLGLALRWHNVWAIVAGNLAQTTSTALAYVLASRWRPTLPRASPEMGELLRFGANASVFSIAIFLSQNAATLLIGRFLGAAPLGQYNRAWALFQMPVTNLIEPIAQATMPLLTRLRQDAAEYRTAYLSLIRKLNTAVSPLSILLFFAGTPLVMAVLGDRWAWA